MAAAQSSSAQSTTVKVNFCRKGVSLALEFRLLAVISSDGIDKDGMQSNADSWEIVAGDAFNGTMSEWTGDRPRTNLK